MTTTDTDTDSQERYTLISADCHAGANHETYREYLDPALREDFDAWRGKYKNPFRDLQDDGRSRNWDNERRNRELEADGVIAEIVFPNTVPPFFPTGALVSRPPGPADFEKRLAGIRTHNRWLVDWCAAQPHRRAGVGQVFLNDIDEAIKDVTWIAEHGLRGGVLIPAVPDDAKQIEPLYSPSYDRLWAVCQDLGVVVNQHSGSGSPDYGKYPAAGLMFIAETTFYSRRGLTHLLMSGVFERFPGLKYVLTETSAGWSVPLLEQLDGFHRQMSSGRIGELGFPAEVVLPHKPSDYFRRNVWFGSSFPSRSEIDLRHEIGVDRIMWGSDYPHHEGTYPFSKENLRLAFSGVDHGEVRMMLSENAAKVYGFDLAALAPLANQHGPLVAEVDVPLDKVPNGATSPAFFRK